MGERYIRNPLQGDYYLLLWNVGESLKNNQQTHWLDHARHHAGIIASGPTEAREELEESIARTIKRAEAKAKENELVKLRLVQKLMTEARSAVIISQRRARAML